MTTRPTSARVPIKARKRLQALVSWLERNGYDEAAGSLREGLEETLTVVKLALPELLRQSLATTNAIENLNGTIRRVSRNLVPCGRVDSMVRPMDRSRRIVNGAERVRRRIERLSPYGRSRSPALRSQTAVALTAMGLCCLWPVFNYDASTATNV